MTSQLTGLGHDALVTGTEEYLASLAAERGLSTNTLRAYRNDLKQYLDFLDRRTASTSLIEAFVKSLTTTGLAAPSVARKLAAVRGLHRFLVAEGMAPNDPTQTVARPRLPASLPKALKVEQAIALVEAPDLATLKGRRDSALLEFLYGTGARVSEAVGLDLSNLDLHDRTALLTGKGNRQRLVPLGTAACVALERWLPDRLRLARSGRDDRAIFLSLRGRRLSRQGIFDIVRHHAARVGIPADQVSPHVLRHSAATHMVEGGADLRAVQELLGHATISTTQVYTRMTVQHLVEVYVQAHPRSK